MPIYLRGTSILAFRWLKCKSWKVFISFSDLRPPFFLSIFPGFHARSIRLGAFLYISLGSRSSFIFFLGAWPFSVPSIQIANRLLEDLRLRKVRYGFPNPHFQWTSILIMVWLYFPTDYFWFPLLSLLISIYLSALSYSYPPSSFEYRIFHLIHQSYWQQCIKANNNGYRYSNS